MRREIYLDHAATSFPKPPSVLSAMQEWAVGLGASAGRGDYPRAVGTVQMIHRCRQKLAGLLGAQDPNRVIFTLNCTDALNIAIHGLELAPGDRVIVGPTEHNSVMRPLNALVRKIGIVVERLPGRADGTCDASSLEALLRDARLASRTRLVAVQHASNVLGAIHDLGAIGAVTRAREIPLLVDAAQTAGSVPIDMERLGIDLLAVPGHKALQGPQGTGALLVSPRIQLEPWRTGGTGSRSEDEEQPGEWPDRLESGSHNAHGIAGLLAGVEWLEEQGVESIRRHELALMERFLGGVAPLAHAGLLAVLGPRSAEMRSPVVSIHAPGRDPRALAAKLWEDHGLMVRPGLHCAPAAHRLAGSWPSGALRFSFGPFTTEADIADAIMGLESVVTAGAGRAVGVTAPGVRGVPAA